MNKLTAPAITKEGKAAVIGGGPAGMALLTSCAEPEWSVTVLRRMMLSAELFAT